METGKMKKKKKKKKVTLLPHRFITPPRSKDFYSVMPSTGPLPPILKACHMSDYLREGVIFQRFRDELRAASGDATAEAIIFQHLYDELLAASGDFKITPRAPRFGSPTISEIPPISKEVVIDLAHYGGDKFPYVNLVEASAVDATPGPSGQA